MPGSVGSGDPSIGIGSDNTVYIGYSNGDNRPHVAVSTDHGSTWINDYEVGAPLGCPQGDQYAACRIKSAVFPVVVAGDGDRASFGFLGSITGGNFQDLATFNGIWDFYVATTYDRGAHWVTVNATAGDPVQQGAICLAGILCTSSNRNLLDFNDISVDSQGRSIAAYADGCVAPACGPPSYSGRAKKAAIVRQLDGRRLFAAYDVVPSTVVSRKTHGSAGTFDVNLPGIEWRSGGAGGDHQVVFTFPDVLTSVAGASVTGGSGSVSSSGIGADPHQYIVNLTGVANAQRVTVTLSNAHDSAGRVSDVSADISQTKSRSGAGVDATNFRSDVTVDGNLNSADIGLVKSKSGTALPP